MIPQAALDAWAQHAPWPDPSDVEQDLILSRLIVDIASHPLLGNQLAFRGGTSLHKLHLLWLGLTHLGADPNRIIEAFDHYLEQAGVRIIAADFAESLDAKLTHRGFELWLSVPLAAR